MNYKTLESHFLQFYFEPDNIFQDATNDDNLDACFTKNSKTLGQCILDCNDDEDCEASCVTNFKKEHDDCPCQVSYKNENCLFIRRFIFQYKSDFRKNVHLDVLAITIDAIFQIRKLFWLFIVMEKLLWLFSPMVWINYHSWFWTA